MLVNAHNLTGDFDRMDDDGGPAHTASLTTRQRPGDASHPATTDAATIGWYRRLGASHRRRDELARLDAGAIQEHDNARRLACYRRWPGIVDAMRTLIGCYNDGAGRETLLLVDGPSGPDNEPSATVTARRGQSLVIAVEDSDLWVLPSLDENGRGQGERWIGLNRTDVATAAYVLQNWLAQLEGWHSATPDEEEFIAPNSTAVSASPC